MPEYQNPNVQLQGGGGPSSGGGGDMRSLLMFGLLAIIVFFGFQYFVKPKAPTPTPPEQIQSQSQTQTPTEPSAGAPPSASQAPSASPAIIAASETATTVENANYRIVFTNRGGVVQHWILKHYFTTEGKPLDMVQVQSSQRFGLPLSLFTYDQNLTTQVNQGLYQPSATGTLTAPNSLTFHYSQNGVDV